MLTPWQLQLLWLQRQLLQLLRLLLRLFVSLLLAITMENRRKILRLSRFRLHSEDTWYEFFSYICQVFAYIFSKYSNIILTLWFYLKIREWNCPCIWVWIPFLSFSRCGAIPCIFSWFLQFFHIEFYVFVQLKKNSTYCF